MKRFTVHGLLGLVTILSVLFPGPDVRGQLPAAATVSARSISGQFLVIAPVQVSPLANQRSVTTNANLVRLEPALLAITAERIKKSLWQDLGIDEDRPWRGQIFLALHAAHTVDDNVTIISSRFNNAWNYRVEMPDIVDSSRLIRAIIAASLLELANRNAGDHAAELPAWLVDGFSQRLLSSSMAGFILSSPTANPKGIPERRFTAVQTGWNLMTEAHRVLQQQDALTFEQMSWPGNDQLAGNDGGVYRVSAQLFVNELLALKHGPGELRTMIETLPRSYNWQIAFRNAFHDDFQDPVDLEKWWSLRIIDFIGSEAGPSWTVAVSRQKLDAALSVPVEYRSSSNNLPTHADISLQTFIRNFDLTNQTPVLEAKLHDLQLAELRMAPRFSQLAGQYCQALSRYLGEGRVTHRVTLGKTQSLPPRKATVQATLKRLDAADAQRRAVETAMEQSVGEMPALTGSNSNL